MDQSRLAVVAALLAALFVVPLATNELAAKAESSTALTWSHYRGVTVSNPGRSEENARGQGDAHVS